ncbi:hypothetical protein GCM10009863_10750 [Streptomyces axinellae]|uniref:Uncharacterized protein n=1 Tax=Streptomyces axinellae TaxID=552788 RepID=A0ABP6C7I0_9ACTN
MSSRLVEDGTEQGDEDAFTACHSAGRVLVVADSVLEACDGNSGEATPSLSGNGRASARGVRAEARGVSPKERRRYAETNRQASRAT